MKRLFLSLTASTLLAFLGCSPGARNTPGNGSSGGSSGSGGDSPLGGQSGSNDTGGNSGSGGVSGSGGESSFGGNQSNGGTTSSGGSQSNGGSSPLGGSSGNGGAGGSGTNACNASAGSNDAAFCNGRAVGVLTGWGWVALGASDTITDPTCDTAKAAITKEVDCKTVTNWTQSNALCMSGSIPALPPAATATDSDYSNNWGVQVGVNAKDPNAAMGGSGYKTITFSVTGTPTTGLRALVHRSGDASGLSYCAPMTPGTAVTLTTFNTKCWGSGGDNLTDADVPSIDQVSVQVTATEAAITVDKLCLTKVELGN